MIRFEDENGVGSLDVAKYLVDRWGPESKIKGVKEGIVHFTMPDGEPGYFSLALWAENNNATIVQIDGFNSPSTALDTPPLGMNYFDQMVFMQDGFDMMALQEMFPKSTKDQFGNVLVLDSDGLWKKMWSTDLRPPEAPLTFEEEVKYGYAHDPQIVLRTAGVHFLFGLTGSKANPNNTGGVKIGDLQQTLRVIQRNAPLENRIIVGKIIHQTTGVDPWKFANAVYCADEMGPMLRAALSMGSFEFRTMQIEQAERLVKGLRLMAQLDFDRATEPLFKLEEAKTLLVNMKQVLGEFTQMLVALDLLRDISRSTGLSEWIALNEDVSFDKTKLPEMPAFVEAFVKLLRIVMPIIQEPTLMMAKGVKGLRSIFHIIKMVDDCLFSLVDVPEHSAKYKMFMALKKVQTMLENKLSFHFQPDPLENRDGLKENPFMQARQQYAEKREMVYKLCQTPKESWNNTLLEGFRGAANIEQELDKLPNTYREITKEFLAMDAAYDMQPWIDADHAKRTHDSFSELNESFGLRPPEAGYLAKNSPRAVQNISETLIEGAAFLAQRPDNQIKENLRNPHLLQMIMKLLMKASVEREIGTVEILNKLSVEDPHASPDPARIWEDPERVQFDQQRQIAEMMGEMAQRQAIQNAQKQQQGMMEEQARMQAEQENGPEKAGKGPRPTPARSAA